MEIKVTLSLSPSFEAIADKLINAISNPGGAAVAAKKMPKGEKVNGHKVEEATSAPDSTEDEKVWTLEEVRSAAQQKANAGKRDEVKGLLKEFDAPNVAGLASGHFKAFMQKLEAL